MSGETKVMVPTIHLNGSSSETLKRDLKTAIDAMYAAQGALTVCAPNARDYYPQGNFAYEAARREHTARVEKVAMVLLELGAVYEGIFGQEDSRARR